MRADDAAMAERSLEQDATRHLREHRPVQKIEKQAVGWRLVNPTTDEPIHLPGPVNSCVACLNPNPKPQTPRPTSRSICRAR